MKPDMFFSVVPWRSPEQFYRVYKCLYSSSITNKRWAVDQISVWETRCHPSLPSAIETTAGLVRSAIQDLLYESEKSFCQAKDVQILYAMALVRFVNLTLEVDQTLKKTQLSILAEKRNIPRWLVELRHEAVHAFCPSLPVLRMGAEAALKFLEDTFWKVEAANIEPIVKTPFTANPETLDLITRYRSIQHSRRDTERDDSKELYRDLKAVLRKLCRHIEDSKEEVIDSLLQPGVFINSQDVVKLLQASAPLYMELEEDMSLPPELEEFWLPIIRILHNYNMIHRFLEKLLLSQKECQIPICQKIATAWAMRLFLATSSHTSNKDLDGCFKNKGVLFYLRRLAYACLIGCNRFSIQFFDVIVHRQGNRENYGKVYCIAAMMQGFFVGKGASDSQLKLARMPTKRSAETMLSEIVFTLHDVEDDLNELKMRRKRPRRDNNIWSDAPVSLDMSRIPLGTVLNPVNVEESHAKEEQSETPVENPPKEESFILHNENDNEEITVEEKDTPDNWLETFRPEQFDMVYRRRQKN